MSNLADKFTPANKTPDRAAGLQGLLPPTRRAAPTPPPEPAVDRPAEGEQPATPTPGVTTTDTAPSGAVAAPAETTTKDAQRPSTARATAGKLPKPDEIVRVPVYVETGLRKLLREAKQRPHTPTYGAIAVEAFSKHTTETLQALFDQPPPQVGNGIPRPAAPVGAPKGGSEIQLHIRADQAAWIEEQRELCGVSSRSHFIATVLWADLRTK